MKTRYSTARSVMGLIVIVGWIAFVIGIFVVFGSLTGGRMAAALLPAGVLISISGLIQVAIAQVSVAVLDMADNSRESLEIQQKLAGVTAVSGSPARQSQQPSATPSGQSVEADSDPNIRIFYGEKIEKIDNRFHWNNETFSTLGKAKAAVKASKGL